MTTRDSRTVAWNEGTWTHAPLAAVEAGDDFDVTAREGSDAWRRTAYGFIHDTEHALVAPLAVGEAVEVEFTADFDAEFDQAGVFVHVDEERWVKAGLEYSDNVLAAGAVVTDTFSDWSVGHVPEWHGQRIVVRVSRGDDALTVRAGVVGEALRLLRVAPFAGDRDATAGPYLAAPTRSGLTVRFHAWRLTAADTSLH